MPRSFFLEWIPREANREADRLADGCFEGFDPALRVHTELSEVRWLVLNDLLAAGQRFYAEAQASSVARPRGRTFSRFLAQKRPRLKEREPW